MGLFSSKKKTIVGVSNTKLIPSGEAPQALKDSVYTYIMDSSSSNGNPGASMVEYTNIGIDKSIVFGTKRLIRWVNKPNKYDEVGSIKGEALDISEEDIRSMVALNIENQINRPVTFYYLNNIVYDYGHFTKQVLIDRYGYNPSSNILTYKGNKLFLEDAVITITSSEGEEVLVGPGFRAGQTPFRVRDDTREYSMGTLIIDTLKQFDYFEVVAVNEFSVDNVELATTTTVVTTPLEGEPSTVVTNTTSGKVISNNIPQEGLTFQTYLRTESLVKEISNETSEDIAARTVTTVVVTSYTSKQVYKCEYAFRDTFTDYFYNENIDWEDLTEEEAFALIDTIIEPNIRIQVGFKYTNLEGEVITEYRTLTEAETSYVDIGNTNSFGSFMPNLYFKYNREYVIDKADSNLLKQSKQYAKKLNLNFKDLAKQIQEEVKDQDKIAQTYIKFGVNYASTEEVDLTYLFYFFQKFFLFCDTNDLYGPSFNYVVNKEYIVQGRELIISDKLIPSNLRVRSIVYSQGLESINPIGTITRFEGVRPESTEGGWLENAAGLRGRVYTAFRRQISPSKYEQYVVVGISSHVRVTGDHWATSGAEGSHLLIPVDFDMMNRLKSFKNKERFLYNSMYVEFLTVVVQKIKFYQRGVFKVILFAVSVAITVLTGGAGVTVSSVLIAAATNLAIGVAIDISIKLLLKVLSPELLKILGIAIIAAGLLFGHTSSLRGLQQFSTKAFTILTMRADLLVKFGVQIVNSANNKQMVDIQDSYLKESKAYQEKMESLDKYKLDNQLYRPTTKLTYLDEDIRYAPASIGESMDALIARSLNTNPSLVAINYVHNYVGFIIELPTPSETVYRPIEDE